MRIQRKETRPASGTRRERSAGAFRGGGRDGGPLRRLFERRQAPGGDEPGDGARAAADALDWHVAYRPAARLYRWIAALAMPFGPLDRELVGQLRRAALSVPLDIAEASAKPVEYAVWHYAIARASARECAGILDALEELGLVGTADLQQPRIWLDQVLMALAALSGGDDSSAEPAADIGRGQA